MSVAAVARSVTIAAVPGQVRAARAFVAAVVCGSYPHVDVALLLASDLVTNSLRLGSGPGRPGDSDCGGPRRRCPGEGDRSQRRSALVLLPAASAGSGAEGSQEMRLVDELAARWGHEQGGGLATTWFELQAKLH